MIRVQTASRLHFGLLSLDTAGAMWPDRDGKPSIPARSFGGAGLMVENPSLRVEIKEANEWSAIGPLAQRALAAAYRLEEAVRLQNPNRQFRRAQIMTAGPAEHVGLGVGTQLSMAVATGLNQIWETQWNYSSLARAVGRGRRSALGVHGFQRGGFLLEAGKRACNDLSPLALRLDFPHCWPIVLVIPRGKQGKHGEPEEQVFGAMIQSTSQTAELSRLALLGLVPAIQTLDFAAFAESIYDYNRRAGEPFLAIQGGVYSSPEVNTLIDWLRGQGIQAVGQTSWGPTVFAVLPDMDQARHLREKLAFRSSDIETIVCLASNQGATIQTEIDCH